MDNASLSNFLSDNAMPLFGELNGDTFDRYLQEGKGLVWSLFPTADLTVEGVQKANRPMMTEVAKKIRGKYFVTYTDTDKFKDAIDSMLGVTTFPAVAVQKKAGDKKKYVYTGEMSAEKISGFIAESRWPKPAWFAFFWWQREAEKFVSVYREFWSSSFSKFVSFYQVARCHLRVHPGISQCLDGHQS